MDKREKELRARLSALQAESAKENEEIIKSKIERNYREAIDALDCKDIEIGRCFYYDDDFMGKTVTYVKIVGIDTEANEAKKKEVQSVYIKNPYQLLRCVYKPRIIVEHIDDRISFRTFNGDELPAKTTFDMQESSFDYECLFRKFHKITPEEYEKKRQEILNKNMKKFFND